MWNKIIQFICWCKFVNTPVWGETSCQQPVCVRLISYELNIYEFCLINILNIFHMLLPVSNTWQSNNIKDIPFNVESLFYQLESINPLLSSIVLCPTPVVLLTRWQAWVGKGLFTHTLSYYIFLYSSLYSNYYEDIIYDRYFIRMHLLESALCDYLIILAGCKIISNCILGTKSLGSLYNFQILVLCY